MHKAFPGFLTDSSGISLLELALTLPLVILVVSGFIDFGIKINTIKDVAGVSREAARIAAAHARTGRYHDETRSPIACYEQDKPIISGTCQQASFDAILKNDSVTVAAFKAACSGLKEVKSDLSVWKVVSRVNAISEDNSSATFQLVQVAIEREGEDCLICYERLSELFKAKAEANFILEEPCHGG